MRGRGGAGAGVVATSLRAARGGREGWLERQNEETGRPGVGGRAALTTQLTELKPGVADPPRSVGLLVGENPVRHLPQDLAGRIGWVPILIAFPEPSRPVVMILLRMLNILYRGQGL
jgi:hypothetical protein